MHSLPLHRCRKGDKIAPDRCMSVVGTNCENTTSKFVHAYLLDSICIDRSVVHVECESFFVCAVGTPQGRVWGTDQWLRVALKSKSIALSASIKIQKSIERNMAHTRMHQSARIKVAAATTVNRSLRQWFH